MRRAVVGLRELQRRDIRSWDEPGATLAQPAIACYNIAADCLRGPGDATALFAVRDDGIRRVSVRELDATSDKLAVGLRSLGLRPSDRVAIKLSQSVDMAVAIFAVLRAAGVVVPVSNVLGDEGVRYRVGHSEARIMIATGSEREQALARQLDVTLVATGEQAPSPTVRTLIEAAPSGRRAIADTAPNSPALLLYSSGASGKPDAVLHSHGVVLGHHTIDYALDFVRDDDISYSPIDWAWGVGLFLGLLVPRAYRLPVVAFRERRFDPDRTLALLRDCRASVGFFPPTALRLLRRSSAVTRDIACSLRLRCLITGGETVEPELLKWAAKELGVAVNPIYGQTEANALIGHSSVLGRLDPSALGRPYPGRRVALLDEETRPVPAGEPGQIAVASNDPVCMRGYWKDSDATTAKFAHGWLQTGDTAHVDDRGQFFFQGRSDDMIKSGAYRIGPTEVEAALLTHPAVADCAVIGLPDPVRGQVVTAFVRLRAPQAASDGLTATLRRQVREKVGAHAYPREVRYVTNLPRTTAGEVDRKRLREHAATATEAQR